MWRMIFACLMNPVITRGMTYRKREDSRLREQPFHDCITSTETSCLIECERFSTCRDMNVIRQATDLFVCQMFNCSISLENSTYLRDADSNFYSVDKSQKGTDCQTMRIPRITFPGSSWLIFWNDCSELQVYCEIDRMGGVWTVFQRRVEGTVDFNRTWSSYKEGFGDVDRDYWLGLEHAHRMMHNKNVTLRFDLWDGNDYYWAEYKCATISNESDNFRFNYNEFQGNTTDAMLKSKGRMFTTRDRDNDNVAAINCAAYWSGGWWHGSCFDANLNGIFGSTELSKGINWKDITGYERSLTKTEVKFKAT